MNTVPLSEVGTCACGKSTTIRCHEEWLHTGMLPCKNWLCNSGCQVHRHQPGTMGYANFERVTADYVRDEPNNTGLREWLRSWWRNTFWSNQKKAQFVWDRFKVQTRPPTPLPPSFRLSFGSGEVYVLTNDKMVREEAEFP